MTLPLAKCVYMYIFLKTLASPIDVFVSIFRSFTSVSLILLIRLLYWILAFQSADFLRNTQSICSSTICPFKRNGNFRLTIPKNEIMIHLILNSAIRAHILRRSFAF